MNNKCYIAFKDESIKENIIGVIREKSPERAEAHFRRYPRSYTLNEDTVLIIKEFKTGMEAMYMEWITEGAGMPPVV